jgi:hypothetical protein
MSKKSKKMPLTDLLNKTEGFELSCMLMRFFFTPEEYSFLLTSKREGKSEEETLQLLDLKRALNQTTPMEERVFGDLWNPHRF